MMRSVSTAFTSCTRSRGFAPSVLLPLAFSARSPSPFTFLALRGQRCTTIDGTRFRALLFDHQAKMFSSESRGGGDEGMQSARRQRRRKISFLTDVEGDGAYFNRYVDNSKILGFRSRWQNIDDFSLGFFPYEREVVFLDDTSDDLLIFGGDVGDKGGSDLYVIRQLLSLSRRYPDRVHFLMGNRDINKMRIVPEMGPVGQEVLPYHGGVWWLKGTGLVGDPTLVGNESKVPSNSPAERLKWILGKTMGSPDAFELRRGELARERDFVRQAMGKHHDVTEHSDDHIAPISDEEVVLSYRKSCHPQHGELGQFLSKANLAIEIGGVMFMHGALPLTPEVLASAKGEGKVAKSKNDSTTVWSNFAFATPWDKSLGGDVSNVKEWIGHLNSFAREQISAWERSLQSAEPREIWATFGGYTSKVSGGHDYGSLLQYGMGWTPDKKRNPTIVYSSWLNDGMPRRFCGSNDEVERSEKSKVSHNGGSERETNTAYAHEVQSFFQAASLQLIVTGHQPHGDLPVPVKINTTSPRVSESSGPRYIVVCDTSYSGDTHWINAGSGERRINRGRGDGASGRGDVAVSELLIDQCVVDGTILGAMCHGVLSDGSKYHSIDLYDNQSDSDASLIGTLLERNDFIFEGSVRDDSSEELPWWVKTKTTNGDFIVATGKGYEIWNSVAKKRHR